ncbi:unnamed protein product [Durusdinium trenchii]|uniref:Transmembrane protein n=1 Tax=Durusdinium trenchii TaxID=1381693 RepID=A0ABP0QPQ2_9DINO
MQPEAGRHGTGSRKGRKSGKKGAGESKGDGGKGLGENVKPGGKGSREKKDKTQGGGKEGGEIRGDVEGRDAEGFESQQYSALPPGPADAECKSFSSEGSTTAHLEGEEEQSVPGGDGKEVRVDVKEEPRDPPRRQTVRFAGDGREGSEIGAASGRGSQCDEGTASGPRARKGETGEGDQDESAEDDKNKMKRKSTVMAAFSRTWTQKLPKGFNCLEHLALALVGGLFGARRSFKAAQTSAHQGHYFSLFLYGLVLTCGRLFLFVLPLALLALGVTFLVKEGPYVEDINKVVRAPGKQPYWMILITGIIGSASINLVLGPPKLVDTPDRQSCWQCVGNVAKRCLTLYLLLWTLWTWGDEIWQLTKIAREQHAAGSPLARILMLAMVQSATSTQWGRYVDQIALLMVFNDYLNFKAAHHDEFVATWSKYMKDVEQAKDSLEKAMVERPLSDGDVPMEKAIARSVLDTPRLVSLIVKVMILQNRKILNILIKRQAMQAEAVREGA